MSEFRRDQRQFVVRDGLILDEWGLRVGSEINTRISARVTIGGGSFQFFDDRISTDIAGRDVFYSDGKSARKIGELRVNTQEIS